MKTKFLIFIFLAAVSFTYGQEKIKGKSQVKRLVIQKEEPKEFPNLEIRNKDFTDFNNNKIIDGNEKSSIKFQVYNSGKGLAENVEVKVKLEDTNTKGITFDKIILVGDLATKQSKDITIHVNADRTVQTDTAIFIIDVIEKNGFDVPFAMTIRTQEFTYPETIVEGVELEEQPPEVITAQPEVTLRGVGDPLKGLNVSKERSEMVVGDYFALIIGIDDYSGFWSPLQNAVRDAKAIKEMLESKYKFEHFRTLYNKMATRQEIIRELEYLVRNVTEEDNVFIYYSGHGEFKKEYNKGYWVPADATEDETYQYVSNNDLQTFLSSIKSKHTLLISDACFSGDIFRGKTISIPFQDTERYYRDVHTKLSRQAITSGGIEPVMDGGRDGHSVFAYYLLKSLGNNNKQFFDAFSLYNDILIPVVNNSIQSPILRPISNTGDEGGQFIFIRK